MSNAAMKQCAAFVGAVGALACAGAAWGEPIGDASFFDAIPHTLIDFETRGDGTPIDFLDPGEVSLFSPEEYHRQGLLFFGMNPLWANASAIPDVVAAQAIGGSPDHVFGVEHVGGADDLVGINFNVFGDPMRAAGIFVMKLNIRDITFAITPIDIDGNFLETVTFESGLIAGTIGTIDFGFIGVASDVPIRSILFHSNDFSGIFFDDLRYSRVPAPGAGVAMLAAAGAAAGRRAR